MVAIMARSNLHTYLIYARILSLIETAAGQRENNQTGGGLIHHRLEAVIEIKRKK
jgi:hypothetical protein